MPMNAFPLRKCLGAIAFSLATIGGTGAAAAPSQRLKIFFDDYYQKSHPAEGYTQGVALNPSDRAMTNFYLPDDNALPNGTWVLAQMIHDKFEMAISHQPISRSLLQSTDSYFL